MEIIKYSNEFLPHIIRLSYPDDHNIDAKVGYYRQKFALYQPEPEQSCLLVKGRDQLLASGHLISFEAMLPGLVLVDLAVGETLTSQEFSDFWDECRTLAHSLVSGPLRLRVLASNERSAALLAGKGLEKLGQQHELHAYLGQLPPEQNLGEKTLMIKSLDSHPELEADWLATFNKGIAAFWDIPPFNSATLQRIFQTEGFDAAAFQLGYVGDDVVAAQFYSVIDATKGIVRLNHASSRSRGHGRHMLKDTLSSLEQQGISAVVIYVDASSQAAGLLYKMLGFKFERSVAIFETKGLLK